MKNEEVVIVAAARTPQGRLGGQLAALSAAELGSAAIRGALDRGGIPAAAIGAVIIGHVLQAGTGQNPAKQAALGAGISWDVPATSVNKVCLSGLTAVIDAKRMIMAGDADVVVAAGMESMTRAPHLLPGTRGGWKYGTAHALDHLEFDGLRDAYDGSSMGLSTEKANPRFDVTREQQDAVALRSHLRAAAAQAAGLFDSEIVPVSVPARQGAPLVLTQDEGVRADSTMATLAGLRPAFANDGTITAGNSSPISDGAAAVILTTRARAEAENWVIMAVVGQSGQVAGPDNSLHAQPARALELACRKQGISPADLDLIEINEAFGAVIVQSQRRINVHDEVVNIHGGGIALGHPLGASGNRLTVHVAHELFRRGTGTAGIALCGGGAQGEAIILAAP
ncbi:acetyl-CoA C-acyltransferase [Arthrobacter sp. ISL-5]|uniref:acetyl-CoA C-acyltransferase n=1 Tax=Arthrobacter sp. ISL-5 TaxID=2819111 RepID=UPI001BEC6F18|nr:acetyl-CoA C-acyltransferase [Arthrobacter sp. ISL-5]MBT2554146.1 acetyl-CoA C-acyltransferase [Arthrobacter sp. ISL-5]